VRSAHAALSQNLIDAGPVGEAKLLQPPDNSCSVAYRPELVVMRYSRTDSGTTHVEGSCGRFVPLNPGTTSTDRARAFPQSEC
jgi:hypothetical protein